MMASRAPATEPMCAPKRALSNSDELLRNEHEGLTCHLDAPIEAVDERAGERGFKRCDHDGVQAADQADSLWSVTRNG